MAKKAKTKDIVEKTIEQTLWDSANELRGNLDAAEYKSVVLGLVFLKYINDCFKVKHEELIAEGAGFEEDPDEYIGDNIFFVPVDARWDKIVKASLTAEIGVVVDAAMEALEKENKQLKGILPKNYARPELDKRRLGNVIDIPLTYYKDLILYNTDKIAGYEFSGVPAFFDVSGLQPVA